MNTRKAVLTRIEQLIDEGEALRRSDNRGKVLDGAHYENCRGWITATQQIASYLFPDGDSPYAQHIAAAVEEAKDADWEWICRAVGEIRAALKNLRVDFEHGLLDSLENRIRAETFDHFLDHARVYLADNRKNEAGVIAGVVFEDVVRRISRNHGIGESGQKLDQLISKLVSGGVITPVMAKRARVAAHVRTKATHAQWDEFETGDVEATIAVADELVLAKLDAQV